MHPTRRRPRDGDLTMDHLSHLQQVRAPPDNRLVSWQRPLATSETSAEQRATFLACPEAVHFFAPMHCVVCDDRGDSARGQVFVEALGRGDLSWLCICSGCLGDSPVDQKNVATLPKHHLQHHSE